MARTATPGSVFDKPPKHPPHLTLHLTPPMKKDPLPAEFVAWLRSYILSAQFTNPRRLFRGLVLRWGFWLDGVNSNALPGYATCPKPTGRTGLPDGWSYQKFHAIARETIGSDRIHTARKAAASIRQDRGSGKPTALVTGL